MCVLRERSEISDAIMTGTGGKRVVEHQRAQRRVAPRAASANGHSPGIDISAIGEVVRGGDAVFDIHNSPLAIQPLAVFTAIARAAAIIDIDDSKSPSGPVLQG